MKDKEESKKGGVVEGAGDTGATARMLAEFDPDAPASAEGGIYGLPFSPAESKVVIIPVPFEATTSYGGGTSLGPAAVLQASRQVDLHDHETGRPYASGIAMLELSKKILRLNERARAAAAPVISGKASVKKARKAIEEVNATGDEVNDWVYRHTVALLAQKKMAVILGGDHSVPFGAIRAYSGQFSDLGILHLDAHADLRDAYEGFTWSHASIFHNVMTKIPAVSRLVQVGVRDLGRAESEMIRRSSGRIRTFFDSDIAKQKDEGVSFSTVADEIVAALPQNVYLSWDIDGLDPTLCPGTGTPVPGGLSWNEAMGLLRALVRARRTIVGLDLCEVSPGPTEWDANVGARLLYKMIGFALLSQAAA